MNLTTFGQSPAGHVARVGQGEAVYWAFVPHPLPPLLTLSSDLLLRLSQADQALGRLAGFSLLLPNPQLLTPVGLRSLAPDDPQFAAVYTGDQPHRDATYHQGMVWTWLIGAYGDACRRWEGMDRAGLLALLAPLQRQLAVDCAGNLNEIFQPLPPYLPKGGFAQAWSVAEVLRLLCSGPPPAAG